jgi:hypothetical protein
LFYICFGQCLTKATETKPQNVVRKLKQNLKGNKIDN